MPTADPLEFLRLARTIAAEAGELAASMRGGGVKIQATKSTPLDVVTRADLDVEQLIRDRLAAARPNDGFLGEESQHCEGNSGITWVVDPIDGTINYLYGSPDYAVSIAATTLDEAGKRHTIAGCVYAPALQAEYTAAAGHPALRNDTPIHVNDDVSLERALVATGFPYNRAKRIRAQNAVNDLVTRVRDFRLRGTASLDLCGVAEGSIDAYFIWGLPVWDYAAAALVASQAGATVHGAHATPRADLILAANPRLTDTLTPFVQALPTD